MATLITLVVGWFAFEAIRVACFSREEQPETVARPRPASSLPALPVRSMARAQSSWSRRFSAMRLLQA